VHLRVAKQYGIDLNKKISELSKDELFKLLISIAQSE
jgi:hypothetical protein